MSFFMQKIIQIFHGLKYAFGLVVSIFSDHKIILTSALSAVAVAFGVNYWTGNSHFFGIFWLSVAGVLLAFHIRLASNQKKSINDFEETVKRIMPEGKILLSKRGNRRENKEEDDFIRLMPRRFHRLLVQYDKSRRAMILLFGLRRSVDMYSAGPTFEVIKRIIHQQQKYFASADYIFIVFNVRKLTYMDSAGLGSVLKLQPYLEFKYPKKTFRISVLYPPRWFSMIIRVAGLASMMNPKSSLSELIEDSTIVS
jgi:hypothetical protein